MQIALARKIPGAKIMALAVDGREMVLRHAFAHRDCPKLIATLHRIRDCGEINETLWRPAQKGEA